MFDSLRERVAATLPKKSELWPLALSFGGALMAKVPVAAWNGSWTLVLAEQMKEHRELVGLGLTAYAIFNLLSVGLDYAVLRRDRVAASPKANTLYRGLTFMFPKGHEFNAAAAEVLTMIMNLVGINPDVTAPASTVASLATGDFRFLAAQRVSDSVVTLVTQIPTNIYLWHRGSHARNSQNN